MLTFHANADEEVFLLLYKKLVETSDMILFRTLVAESLYRNTQQNWHKKVWSYLLTDRRVYLAYSMPFWIDWGLRHHFAALSRIEQEKIVSCISQCLHAGGSEKLQASYAWCIKPFLSNFEQGATLLQCIKKYRKLLSPVPHPRQDMEPCRTVAIPDYFEEHIYLQNWNQKSDATHFKTLSEVEERLCELIDNKEEKEPSDDLRKELYALAEKSRTPLAVIFQRKNDDLECGYPQAWAIYILKALRIATHHVEKNVERKQWQQALQTYTPWLEDCMERVRLTFDGPLPQGGEWEDRGFEGLSSWSDPWISSIGFWDQLALPPIFSSITEWEKPIIQIISHRANAFSERLRMYFALRLRPFHWARIASLKNLLWKWFVEASDAQLLCWYLRTAQYIFRDKIAELLQMLLAKADITGKPANINRLYLGPLLASAWYRQDRLQNPQIAQLGALAEQFLQGKYQNSIAKNLVYAFSRNLLEAYRVGLAETYINLKHYIDGLQNCWQLCQKINVEGEEREGNGSRHFASLVGFSFEVPKNQASIEKQLWRELKHFIIQLALACDLPGLTDLIYALQKSNVINQEMTRLSSVPPDWDNAIVVAEAILNGMLQIREKIPSTTDLGYAGALAGRDLVNLLEHWISALGAKPDPQTNKRLNDILCKLETLPDSGAERLRFQLQ